MTFIEHPKGFWIQSGNRYHKIGTRLVEKRLGKWMVCERDERMRVHALKAYSTPEEAMDAANNGDVPPIRVVPTIPPGEAWAIVVLSAMFAVLGAYLLSPSPILAALLASLTTSAYWFFLNSKGINNV